MLIIFRDFHHSLLVQCSSQLLHHIEEGAVHYRLGVLLMCLSRSYNKKFREELTTSTFLLMLARYLWTVLYTSSRKCTSFPSHATEACGNRLRKMKRVFRDGKSNCNKHTVTSTVRTVMKLHIDNNTTVYAIFLVREKTLSLHRNLIALSLSER